MLEEAGLAKAVCKRLGLPDTEPDLTEWENMVRRAKSVDGKVTIALVGKYTALHDAYLSVVEALTHGGIENDVSVEIKWVDSEGVNEQNAAAQLGDVDGIIVPGGFGDRGIEGMIASARYARENGVPYFGICLGMQMAVVEYARHVCGLEGAHSSELSPNTKYPVIDIMPDQVAVTSKGGTMRLGAYPCVLAEDSRVCAIYGVGEISERHRHRYEFNNQYRETLTEAGLRLGGLSPNGRLVEIVEVPEHPWYVGVQFHPELKSRPNHAHPCSAISSAPPRKAKTTGTGHSERKSEANAARTAPRLLQKEAGVMWILLAFGSAFFAGVTSILAKAGIRETDSNLATAIRTIIVLIFSWIMVFLVGSRERFSRSTEKRRCFWCCRALLPARPGCVYFRALQLAISTGWYPSTNPARF